MKSGDLLSLPEAADYLGMSRRTLCRMIDETRRLHRHGLPDPDGIAFRQFHKKGRVIFARADLDDYIARHTVDPAKPPRIATKPARERRRVSQPPRFEIGRHW